MASVLGFGERLGQWPKADRGQDRLLRVAAVIRHEPESKGPILGVAASVTIMAEAG